MKPTDFAYSLSRFFEHYLAGQRNTSPNTIKSYRDTFKLLLLYCQQQHNLASHRLQLKNIDKDLVIGFLDWLEEDRNNSLSTRNQRLVGLHSFYQYMHREDPTRLLDYQHILSIPMKKAPTVTPNYLTVDALKHLLSQPDRSTVSGRRDLTLLSVLYDTGARVQELVDLTLRDVRLDPPAIVTLTGKGRKSRQVPLMPATESLLKHYIDETFKHRDNQLDKPLFYNRQHSRMTRAGISYILNKYVGQARATSNLLPDKITPHVMRHTRAMLLLQAGVNLIYIRDLLGHVDIATTEVYARADTEMKRKALESAYPEVVDPAMPHWTKDDDLLSWLKQL